MRARIEDRLARLRSGHESGDKVDTKDLKAFLVEQEEFLRRMNLEIWEDDQITTGRQPELVIPDAADTAAHS